MSDYKYKVVWTSKFKKDYKQAIKSNKKIELLDDMIRTLSKGEKLPSKYRDHALSGNWPSFRECHIEPDWLLIYKIDSGILVLTLSRNGSHRELF